MNFLTGLLARARGEATALRPRRASPFERAENPGDSGRVDAPPVVAATTEGAGAEPRPQSPVRVEAAASPADVRTEPHARPSPHAREARESVTLRVELDALETSAADKADREARSVPAASAAVVPASLHEDAHGHVPARVPQPIPTAPAAKSSGAAVPRPPAAVKPAAVPATAVQARVSTKPAGRQSTRHVEPPTSKGDTIVRIDIGRIEIRADREEPSARPVRQAPAPRLTLDEYSRQRTRGER